MTPATQTRDVLSFGPFSLVAGERLLTRDGVPVELGARALDILIALVSRPNEVVSKKDLLDRVWPDVTVEESSLRFALAGLRKVLGDGQDGARYITTLAGRGYCFVAPISRSGGPRPVETAPLSFPHANLPGRLTRMVGRDDDVLKISAQLNASRFVTIVGAGGVGKTTVAIAVGHHLLETFAGAVLFVDLGMLSDPNLVATAVASMLGLSVQSERRDAEPDRVSAGQANSADPRHLRASHRRRRNVGGRPVRGRAASPHPRDQPRGAPARRRARLPPGSARLSAGRPGAHRRGRPDVSCDPAVHGARGGERRPPRAQRRGSRDRRRVSAASSTAWRWRSSSPRRRVEAYGLQQTAALLDQRLTLLWLGPRTAPPRQKTLQATLDWSYGLLVRTRTRGAAPARRVRRTFHARCGAGRRDERRPSIRSPCSAPSTASSPSRWSRPARSAR